MQAPDPHPLDYATPSPRSSGTWLRFWLFTIMLFVILAVLIIAVAYFLFFIAISLKVGRFGP